MCYHNAGHYLIKLALDSNKPKVCSLLSLMYKINAIYFSRRLTRWLLNYLIPIGFTHGPPGSSKQWVKLRLITNVYKTKALAMYYKTLLFIIRGPGECFTKIKIDFKLDLTMTGHSYLLSSFTGNGLSQSDVQVMVTHLHNSAFLIVHYWRKKYYLKINIERPMVRATSGMNGLSYLSPI